MVAEKGGLAAVCLEYLDLPASTIAFDCRKDGGFSQQVNEVVYMRLWVDFSYRHLVELCVVDMKMQFSVFFWSEEDTICQFGYCWLAHVFFEHLITILTVLLSCMKHGPTRMLKGWRKI